MPIKNGLEVAENILKINKDTKIIMISGKKEIKQEVIDKGIYCFLEKPSSFKELKKILKNI